MLLTKCILLWFPFLLRVSVCKPIPLAARLLGLRGRIPPGDEYLSLMSVFCCQVEASATSRSLVQRSLTEYDVSEWNREAWIMKRPWPTSSCCAIGGGGGFHVELFLIKWRLQICCVTILRNCVSIARNKVLMRAYQIHCRLVDFLNQFYRAVLRQKLIVARLVSKLRATWGSRRFFTMSTRIYRGILFCGDWLRSTAGHPIFIIRSTVIISFHERLNILNGQFHCFSK
jgi:hypothetical protein